MAHAHSVADCCADLEKAVGSGDRVATYAAYAALAGAMAAEAAPRSKAATAAAAAVPDADVLAAVGSAEAAVQAANAAPQPPTPAGIAPPVGAIRDDLWDFLMTTLIPGALEWFKKRFSIA